MKVKFLRDTAVALDENGIRVVHAKKGDVAELNDAHAERLLERRPSEPPYVEAAKDEDVVNVGVEVEKKKPAKGRARGGNKPDAE